MLSGRFMSAMPSSDIFDNDNSGLSRQLTAFISTSLSCGTWFEYSTREQNVINNSQQQCKLLNRTNFLTSISVPRISAAVPWIAGSWSFSLSKDNFRHVCVHEWLPLFLLNRKLSVRWEHVWGKLLKIAFSSDVVWETRGWWRENANTKYIIRVHALLTFHSAPCASPRCAYASRQGTMWGFRVSNRPSRDNIRRWVPHTNLCILPMARRMRLARLARTVRSPKHGQSFSLELFRMWTFSMNSDIHRWKFLQKRESPEFELMGREWDGGNLENVSTA